MSSEKVSTHFGKSFESGWPPALPCGAALALANFQ